MIKDNQSQKKSITFVLYRPDKTILMQLRDENCKHYPNKWCFPGGCCEKNEKPIDTVIREVKEEYGLKIDKSSRKLIFSGIHPAISNKISYVFLCFVSLDQQPVLNEGADMKWMTIKEIKSISLGFGQEVIISYIEKNIY